MTSADLYPTNNRVVWYRMVVNVLPYPVLTDRRIRS